MADDSISAHLRSLVPDPALADRLLEAYPGTSLAQASEDELTSILGDDVAAGVLRAIAFGRALHVAQRPPGVSSQYGLELYVRSELPSIGTLEQETMWVIVLNSRMKPLFIREVARGSVAAVDVHPREVFKPAIRVAGHSIALVHNHPSGEAIPSASDDNLTERMAKAGHMLGIPLLDHLIVTADAAYSYGCDRPRCLSV